MLSLANEECTDEERLEQLARGFGFIGNSRQVLQNRFVEVGGGNLQGVEHEAGGFAFDFTGGQQAHDLGEGGLDGAGILKQGQGEWRVAAVARLVAVKGEELFVLALVVVAEAVVAHGGRSALSAVDHDVQAWVGQTGHDELLPLDFSGLCNLRVSGILRFSLRAAISYGQNLEPQRVRRPGKYSLCFELWSQYVILRKARQG